MIVQSLFDGELTIHTTPGPKWVGMGKTTKYSIRDKVWFIDDTEQHAVPKDAKGQPSFPIMFNDGGDAKVNGSIDYELPLDTTNLLSLHARYRSQEALENSGIRPTIAKSVYVSGPLMSATESYAARKNDLLASITDQTLNGIYRTRSSEVRVRDDVTGSEKTLLKAEIVKATNGVASAVWDKAANTHTAAGTFGAVVQSETDLLNLADGVETNITLKQALRILLAVGYGKASGSGTNTIKFRDPADTVDRVTMNVDVSSNRVAVNHNA